MQIDNQRIRLAIDTSQMGSINDVLTGANPQFWNGVDLQIELGIFYGSTLVDVSNFSSITVDLKESDPRTGLPLMSQTIASGSINDALTLTAWNGGAPTDCHALAVFTNEETNLYLNQDSVTFWLVVSALTGDTPAHKVVLGATPMVVQEGGEGVEPPASVVNPTYYTAAQSDARYAIAVNLTSINNSISTLISEMTAVTATANAALPLTGGTLTGALSITGLSGILQATSGLISGSATTSALPEGSNLYWTQTRFNTALAAVSGAAGGICPLNFSSLIPAACLPPVAFNNLHVVGSQTAMLALSANPGDLAVRTDLSETFFLTASPASTLGNWTQLLSPANAVSSVNSLTGAVVLTTTNIAEGTNLYFTNARAQAQALAATLTGFSNATGGAVTSADTVLSALGKFENRMALNDAKVSASGYVLANGSVAMTGMLNFTGSGNAGIQLSNLTDTQRAALSATNGMLIYNTTLNCLEYYNGAWLTIAAGGAANWYNGSGAPSSSIGNNGDYYLNLANGAIYQKSAGSWAVIYSLSAAYAPLAGATFTGNIQFSGTTFCGLTLNSLTATQRDALSPVNGMLHWNTTDGFVEVYNSGVGGGFGTSAHWHALVDGQSASASYVAINGSNQMTGQLNLVNLTTTAQNALSSPDAGAVIFNTTLGYPTYYTGSAWAVLGGSSGTLYTSSPVSLSAGTTLVSAAHGLGATPSFVRAVLVYQTAELSFSVGDEIDCSYCLNTTSPVYPAFGLRANATNVYLTMGGTGTTILVENPGNTGVGNYITISKWQAKVYARL